MSDIKQVKTSKNTSDGIFQLFEALMRLAQGRTIRVPNETSITLKSVALEAGKSPGIIKKQRPVYAELIKEIKRCAAEQKERGNPQKQVNEATRRWKEEAERSKNLYHQSLARELMLLHQLDEAEHLLRNSENVLQFPSKPEEIYP
ncbi:hypothetical protein [Pseudomonas fluorescens]|uniref:hypothetical protein n=1 Tax=Pseudomonas fluorescens TaxID=294 RepID=UPI00069258BB|nr:hypothetical protein [Pseudomonas fluorescens]